MKFMKKKSIGDVTVRTVMNDAKSKILCVVGTVEDLTKIGLLYKVEYLDKTAWLALSNCDGIGHQIGKSRAEVLEPFTAADF